MEAVAAPVFLSDAELIRLTGFRWKSKQAEWLREQGFAFTLNARGHPRVLLDVLKGRAAAPASTEWTPRVLGR